MMARRGFLRALLAAPVAAVVAPDVLKAALEPTPRWVCVLDGEMMWGSGSGCADIPSYSFASNDSYDLNHGNRNRNIYIGTRKEEV